MTAIAIAAGLLVGIPVGALVALVVMKGREIRRQEQAWWERDKAAMWEQIQADIERGE